MRVGVTVNDCPPVVSVGWCEKRLMNEVVFSTRSHLVACTVPLANTLYWL